MFFSFASFGQNEQTINLNVKEVKDTDIGIFSLGQGAFVLQQYMVTHAFAKKMKEINNTKTKEQIEEYAKERFANSTITNTTYFWSTNRIKVNFNLTNEDGSVYLVREEALKELKELKELLDLGILTQEEFNKKAAIYKRVILN